jgi:hypothetical protein
MNQTQKRPYSAPRLEIIHLNQQVALLECSSEPCEEGGIIRGRLGVGPFDEPYLG